MEDWQNKDENSSNEFIKEEIIVREHFVNQYDLPNVEDELNKFHQEKKLAKAKFVKLWTGIAASLLIGAFAYLFLIRNSTNVQGPEAIVFKERSSVAEVLLKSGDRDVVAVGSKNDFNHMELVPHPQAIEGGLSYLNLEDNKIQQETLTVPNGKIFKVVLQDGSEVWLNSQTKFIFPNRFGKGERRVLLTGEAYFRVTKDQKRPFIVETDGLETRVLGTEFNVNNDKGAQSKVTLLKGKVEVTDRINLQRKSLLPGDELVKDPHVGLHVHKIDLDSYYSWHEGYFYFDQAAFSDVLREIGRWYNMDIVFENPKVSNVKIRFTADRNEDKQVIIELLNDLKIAKIDLEKNAIVVR